jgi:polysaccharide export outer membrane protein
MTLPLFLLVFLFFQAPPTGAPALAPAESPAHSPTTQGSNQTADIYTLGPGDRIVIQAVNVEEIDGKQPVMIDSRGNIDLPVVGRIRAAGLTQEQLEEVIQARLRKFLVNPDVSVSLAEMHSQPISVLGAVQTPGVHQLQGQKTLFEVLSLAGGLRPDAGYRVKITRRLEWGRIPLPDAADDPTGQFSVASVDVKNIMSATNPADNILIKPHDVVSVPKGDIIYVIGAVKKPGAFVMGENRSLSALQVLSLAEGLERTAAAKSAKIMRAVSGTDNRAEIPVDLSKILTGKSSDMPLKADDILFIPTSAAKSAGFRALEALAQGSSMAIYRIP